jgi:hypothetical protein
VAEEEDRTDQLQTQNSNPRVSTSASIKARSSLASGTTAVAASQEGNELAEGVDLTYLCRQLMKLYNTARQVLDSFCLDTAKERQAAIRDGRIEDTRLNEMMNFHRSGVEGSFLHALRTITPSQFIDPENVLLMTGYGSLDGEATEAVENFVGLLNEFNLAMSCLKALEMRNTRELLSFLEDEILPRFLATWFKKDGTKGSSRLSKSWLELIINLRTRLVREYLLENSSRPHDEQQEPLQIVFETLLQTWDPRTSREQNLKNLDNWHPLPGASSIGDGSEARKTLSLRMRRVAKSVKNGTCDPDIFIAEFKECDGSDGLELFFDFATRRYKEIESRSGKYQGARFLRDEIWRIFELDSGRPYSDAPAPLVVGKKKSFMDKQEGARPVQFDDGSSPPPSTDLPAHVRPHRSPAKRTREQSNGPNIDQNQDQNGATRRKRMRNIVPPQDELERSAEPESEPMLPPTQEAQSNLSQVRAGAKDHREDRQARLILKESDPASRRKWDAAEEAALVEYIGAYGPKYSKIKKMDDTPDNGYLRLRSAEDLRFKARNLKVNFYE